MNESTSTTASAAAHRDQLSQRLEPIRAFLAGLDLGSSDARDQLEARFPAAGPAVREIAALLERGVAEGWLFERDARFASLRKAADARDVSIDAVRGSGPGRAHAHPNGEVDLCFAVDPGARFDGHEPGWVVYGPGSWHVPTVSGGAMTILFFLPGGAIEVGPKPA